MEIVIGSDVFTVTEETSERVYYKDELESIRFVERSSPDWKYSTHRVMYVMSRGGFHAPLGDLLENGVNLIEVPAGMTDEAAIQMFETYADGLGTCYCGMPAKLHLGHPQVIEVKPITRIAK